MKQLKFGNGIIAFKKESGNGSRAEAGFGNTEIVTTTEQKINVKFKQLKLCLDKEVSYG